MQTRLSVLRIVGVTVLAAAGAWVVAAAQQGPAGQHASGLGRVEVGKSAPDFTLVDSAGKTHRLSDYKDRVVVLEWLNQECPWSVKAVPDVKSLYDRYAKKGVVWLGIDSTHWRRPEQNVKYARDKGIPFPILGDADGKVGRLYGARTTPHLFVIEKGTIVYAGALHNNQYGRMAEADARNYVDEALAAVLAGKKVPLSETKPWGCSVKYKEANEKK